MACPIRFFFFTFSPVWHWFSSASLVFHYGSKNSFSPELWYVHLFLSAFISSTPCCWLGSVLGLTCPQNEYTFACISALPWLACYPLCRRVWLMIWMCHFSQQLSGPPACAHSKHKNTEWKKKPISFAATKTKQLFPMQKNSIVMHDTLCMSFKVHWN